MARQARKESSTGIFHVMMRGINHQNIFEEPEDYYQFIATLDRMRVHYDEDGSPSGINCTYYAYCLMSNHFHLLIREREERVGETIKRIAGSYVYYQNPVKAGIVEHVREYEFSSWGEYDGSVDSVFQICDTAAVLRGKPYEQLNDFPHGTCRMRKKA